MLRPRYLLAACALALIAFRVPLADAVSAPDAPHSAPVARSGSPTPDSHRALTDALRAAAAFQAQRDADLTAWYAAASKPAPAPKVAKSGGSGSVVGYEGDVWWALALCESGGDPAKNTGNGFYGAFQFLPSTWHSIGYSGLPSDYDYATQKQAAQELQARSGWSQWPQCAKQLGLL